MDATMKALLQDAVDDYLSYRRSQGKAVRTIANEHQCLRRFLTSTGNIFVENIVERHVTEYMTRTILSRPRSINLDHTYLTQFFRWARSTKRAHRDSDPMFGRGSVKVMPRERQRVPLSKFPALLDAAEGHSPRDRLVVALGLYLFPRASEVRSIRIRDVSLDLGEIYMRIHKTRKEDHMPISQELDQELRTWMTYYSNEAGSLDPNWFLAPAKTRASFTRHPVTGRLYQIAAPVLQPTKPMSRVEEAVKRALVDIGMPTRDAEGKPLGEGMHTLRRSGARVYHDILMSQGKPNPIRAVQAMLHHSSQLETERYLGIEADRQARNDLVKGQRMYPQDKSNVLHLGRATASGETVGLHGAL